jgi:C1A family cysteine protease
MATFKKVIKNFADHNDWQVEWGDGFARIDFETEDGDVQSVFITNNGETVEFDVFSELHYGDGEEINHEISTQLLQRNAELAVGAWVIETVDDGSRCSVMYNVRLSVLENMPPDALAARLNAILTEAREFLQVDEEPEVSAPVLTFEGDDGGRSLAGYQFVQANPNSKEYAPSPAIRRAALPRKVDLRPFLTPVEDQGQVNSCSANAIAGAYEYLIKRHLKADVDVSRLFIYYNARWRADEQNKDCGSVIQYGMESLGSFGACVEKTWPYVVKVVCDKPNNKSYAEASKFKSLDIQHMATNLKLWKQCLAEGYPIVFGCVLFDTFDECKKRGGVVPMPDPNAVGRGEHGRHAMLCVGYSDVDEVFIVRNSWGKDWADGGYCYMPYNYLINEKFNGGDCWILRTADNLPEPEITWVEDKRSVIKIKITFIINAYPVDAYDRVKVAFYDLDNEPAYSDEVPETYITFSEAIEYELPYLEDREEYVYVLADEDDADVIDDGDAAEEEEYEESDDEEDDTDEEVGDSEEEDSSDEDEYAEEKEDDSEEESDEDDAEEDDGDEEEDADEEDSGDEENDYGEEESDEDDAEEDEDGDEDEDSGDEEEYEEEDSDEEEDSGDEEEYEDDTAEEDGGEEEYAEEETEEDSDEEDE